MTIGAILFDHDGTLVDSEYSHYEMWCLILESYGVPFPVETYIQNHAGIPTPANAALIVDNYSLAISPSTLVEAKKLAMESLLSRQAFPITSGAIDTIKFFKQQGVKLAVVTGAGREGVDATIQWNNLEDYFQLIVSGDDVNNSKPSPDCYLLAAQRLGVKPSACIAIEDSENGVTAAISAGVPCVAISTAMSKYQNLSGAVKVCGNLKEAKIWISNSYRFDS